MSRLVRELYLGKREERKRLLVTPEGIAVRVVLADGGTRASAFALDLVIIGVVLALLGLLVSLVAGGGDLDGWRLALIQLAAFLLLNFYFIFFELRWQGRTPAKRLLGLRTIDAGGGSLSAQAIFARNLVRDVELFLPVAVLANPAQVSGSSSGLVRLASVLWALGLLLWPLFNKERRRLGDYVGGTMVVFTPRSVLLDDVVDDAAIASGTTAPAAHRFTDAQLDAYGEYELQVLENLLRGAASLDHEQALSAVSRRIQRKIGYDELTGASPEAFLRDFYAALRARLERKRLFGKRKKDKYS